MSDVEEPVRVRRINDDQVAGAAALAAVVEAVAGCRVDSPASFDGFRRRLLAVTAGWSSRTRDAVLYALLVEHVAGVAPVAVCDVAAEFLNGLLADRRHDGR